MNPIAPAALFDTHFHLEAQDDPGALVARAQVAGVTRLLLAGAGAGEAAALLDRVAPHPAIYAAVGVHPHEAAQAPADVAAYRALAARPRVVAIGEIGLDYHYDHSPRDVQRRVFADFLALARELDLPAIVHCREAHADCVALLRDGLGGQHRFVVHCFSGTVAEGAEFLALGGWLSYTGMLTFPKAENVRAALRATPLDRVMFETDAPYLAPVPHRGKRNEPAFLPGVVARAATELGLSFAELAARSTANAERFFALPPTPPATVTPTPPAPSHAR